MLYWGIINQSKIKSIKATKLEKEQVLEHVEIDDQLLNEKDSWYYVDNKEVCFFKARNDARLFGECLAQEIFESMNIESAKYEIVSLNKKIGLLTKNFQKTDENFYFDLYNLYKMLPTVQRGYNNYTFKNLLENISYQPLVNKKEIIQELIDRYIGDWVTHQTDGNPRNLMFMFEKITNSMKLAPSYDRERCFGIDETFDSKIVDSIWIPSIPYEDVKFKKNPYEADTNMDANIFALYLDYPEETIKAFNRVFNVDYESIFNKYRNNLYQFSLPDETINYLCDIINKKDMQKKKILTY